MIERVLVPLRAHRTEVLALLALFAGIALVPIIGGKTVPAGIYGRGLVTAAALTLHATGVVLAYRSDRFLNIAQVQLGAVGGTAFALLTQAELPFRALAAICPPCGVPGSSTRTAVYWGSVAVGVLIAMLAAGTFYTVVVRRLADSSRLVVTVASVFVVQFLVGLRDPVVDALVSDDQRLAGIPGGPNPPPHTWNIRFGGAVFTLVDVIVLAAAVLALLGLARYLRSRQGAAIRAVSASRDRAAGLGVNVDRVAGRVWLLIGALSGVAAITAVMAAGDEATSGGVSIATLVRILAIAVVARLSSLALVPVAAVALGLLDQVVLWVVGSTLPVDGALVLIIGGLLLAQRRGARRTDTETLGARDGRQLRGIPTVMRGLPEVVRYRRLGTSALVVVLLALPWILSPSQTNRVTTAMLTGIILLSLLLLTGWAGLASLGQVAFAAVGAWVAAVSGLPVPIALLLGGLAGAAVATLVGIPALRLDGLYLAITTLAFALATTAVLLNPRYLGGLLPSEIDRPVLLGFDLDDQRVSYAVALIALTLTALAVRRLRASRTGRVLLAARDNESAVAAVGVSVTRARLTAFALSGAIAAGAGVLLSYQQGGVLPETFGPGASLDTFVIAVIGGFGSVAGPLLGVAYLATIDIASTDPTVLRLTSGLGGLLLILAIPGGLAQVAANLRDAGLRRVARRHRLIVPSLIADQRLDAFDDRAPLRPHLQATGGAAFVPQRYGLDDQWLVEPRLEPVEVAPRA